jgi:serine phosphatase RsbU (regulator of sigma subunit)/Tfp pilus assembly protein PilF
MSHLATIAQPNRTDSLLRLLKTLPQDSVRVMVLADVSFAFYNSDAKQAKQYAQAAIDLAKKIDYPKGLARGYNVMGVAYQYQDDYSTALEYHQKALSIREQIGDSVGIASSLNNIGIVFYSLKNFPEALKYYERALEVRQRRRDSLNLSSSFNNIGSLLWTMGDSVKSLAYSQQAIQVARRMKRPQNELDAVLNLGDRYRQVGRAQEAEETLILALDLAMSLKDDLRLTYAYQYLAQVYLASGRLALAKDYIDRGLKVAQKGGFHIREADLLGILSEYYEKQGDPTRALQFFKQKTQIADSLTNLERSKQAMEMQGRYNTAKQEAENERLRQEARFAQQVNHWQQWAIGLAVTGLLGVGGLAFRLNKTNQKRRQLNRELAEKQQEVTAQNEELIVQQDLLAQRQLAIEAQNELLAQKNHKINQSIGVAQYIQGAVLPGPTKLAELLGEHFVLFMPKDVVSGDFYWIQETMGRVMLVVADCTGHGVPGAFMSLIGDALLDRLVLAEHQTDPAELLYALNEKIIDLFDQPHLAADQAAKFGMDATVVCLEQGAEGTYVAFAGAKRPLVVAPPGKPLETWPAQLRSLGHVHLADQPVENQSALLPPGTMLYLFSDGFTDQCNPQRQKFGLPRLHQALAEVAPLPANEQKDRLLGTLAEFQQEAELRDDILLLGVRV